MTKNIIDKLEKFKNPFPDTEKEIISLKVIIETIDSMVNLVMFELLGDSSSVEILFHTEVHQKYFYIIFVDFLSETDESITGKKRTCIDLLDDIIKNPNFNENHSIKKLEVATQEFKEWIDCCVTIEKIWFPSINQKRKLKLARKDFIYICGNISKHHFARLTRVVNKMIKIFQTNNIIIDKYQALALIDDFYEKFHNDILNYHASNIAEMLNNIRWGIHEYLLPQFRSSYLKDKSDLNEMSYSYTYPENIKDDFAKKCYWNLMNSVRSKPYIKKFEVTEYLKKRY